MPEIHTEYAVLGAGISGLTAAYYLQQTGKEVWVIEKENRAGGALYSNFSEPFLFENGANSAANHPALKELVSSLGMQSRILKASDASKKRYITRNGKLHEVSPSPKFLLGTSLLSMKGRLRLLKEPFVKSSSQGGESAEAFFVRRLGREAYDYLINPVLGGIYAGKPDKMEFRAIMPRLYDWEKEFGSLFKGMRKGRSDGPAREVMSFQNGMAELTTAIADRLGNKLLLGEAVYGVEPTSEGYLIKTQHEGGESRIFCKKLIWALPAHQSSLMESIYEEGAKLLREIPYVPMGMLHVAYPQEVISDNFEGFGFLVPEKESQLLLGAIWNHSVFPDRCPEGFKCFTLFVGGGRTPFSNKKEFEEKIPEASRLFASYMGISEQPNHQASYFWSQAIPQYRGLHIKRAEDIEKNCPKDMVLVGNYLKGVSVGDCIQFAREAIKRY